MPLGVPSYMWRTTATVQRKTPTSDGTGSTSKTWATHGTIKGLLTRTATRANESVEAAQLRSKADFAWHCPVGSDIVASDRLVIEGKTYDVIGTDAGLSMALDLTVWVTKA